MNQICMGYVKSDLQMCDQKKAAINAQADVESLQTIVVASNETFYCIRTALQLSKYEK